MDFTSFIFWLVLLPALLVFGLVSQALKPRPRARQIFQKLAILTLSLSLLGMVSWETLLIFVLVMLLCYAGCRLGLGLGMRARKWLLVAILPTLLLPLLYYKYAYFFGSSFLGQNWDTLRDLIIPVGISFYSFQLAGFCVDTLVRSMPMPRFLDYMNFGAFFPQIVAGPIERRENLLPQMEQLDIGYKQSDVYDGVRYIILGLFFKMVLGDNLALGTFSQYGGSSAIIVWFSNLCFSLRIYFDFCGYGLTAYGIARCLGIKLTLNFLSPYTATNISEFWRRWHVSLTNWFRDYIYIPLGGNRTRIWFINILLVFAISGLWHGANWNFIIWGALAGFAILVHRLFRQVGGRIWAPISYLMTLGYMVLAWMFFYVTDMKVLWRNITLMCTPARYNINSAIHELPYSAYDIKALTAFVAILLSAVIIVAEYYSAKHRKNPYELLLHPAACAVMVYLLVVFTPSTLNQFIYFAF